MKKLLIIENNGRLDEKEQRQVFAFVKEWDGEIIDFSGFSQKSTSQIIEAIGDCTDIITQTCFVNGSDSQFQMMVSLLAKFPDSKNIYISYLGGNLFEYMDRYLEDVELVSIKHHNVFEWKYKDDYSDMEAIKMDFSERINALLNKIENDKKYHQSATTRTTGRKIKILACNGCGKAFDNLPIGEVVDELEMDKTDPNKKRGVWVWGNGEPIKLVNDCGLKEYEIASEIDFSSFIYEVRQLTGLDLNHLNGLEKEGVLSLLEDEEETDISVANFICEQTNIPKRHNRECLRKSISQLREDTFKTQYQ